MGFIFHSRVNKDGTQALMYQVKYFGKKFTVPTGVSCKRGSFKNGRIKGVLVDVNQRLAKIELVAQRSMEEGKMAFPQWTPSYLKLTIDARLNGSPLTGPIRKHLDDYWKERIDFFEKSGKYANAEHNRNSLQSIFKYLDRDIYLDELSRHHLAHASENLLIGRSPSSVNGYFRDLRAVINRAIIDELIKTNPFTGFKLPAMRYKNNVALDLKELRMFARAKTNSPWEEIVKDTCMIMYLCLGMRVTDALTLKKENRTGNTLKYTTSKNNKYYEFQMKPAAVKILNKYDGHYLLPILNPSLKGKDLVEAIKKTRGVMRQTMNRIAKRAGITKNISSHTFRHTWNYINDHLSLKERQKGLGHSTEKTTEKYDSPTASLNNLSKQTKY